MTSIIRPVLNSLIIAAVTASAAFTQVFPKALEDLSFGLRVANDTRSSQTISAATPAPSELDQRLARAQERFQSGKRFLQEGNLDAARAAFDRAIEILLNAPLAAEDRARAERRLEELVDLIYRYDVDQLGSGDENSKKAFDKSPLDEIRELSFPIDPKQKGLVRQQIEATASQLPLETNDAVLSFVNYFSNGKGRATLINGWRRSNRYRPMIQRILAEERVPQELIFLAQAESGFLPRAVSRKAATGMWQFVQWRGREYGLTQTPLIDLRLDPETATRAAARHLRDLYMQFGDWYLAIAAYNCGPGCVDRAVQRTGYADYWELRRRNGIPRETANYVPIILALTIVTRNATQYGIELEDPDPALEYETMRVEAQTSLDLIADAADLPVSAIRELNPALLKSVAPAGHDVKVPKGQSTEIATVMKSVPSAQRASWRLHRVRSGESLGEIAQRYRTTERSILSVNDAQAQIIEGSVLMIPATFVPDRKPAAKATARKPAQRTSSKQTSKTRPQFKTAGRRASL